MKFSLWLEKKKLKGDQHKLDVAPPFGKIDHNDFEKLRKKKKKMFDK